MTHRKLLYQQTWSHTCTSLMTFMHKAETLFSMMKISASTNSTTQLTSTSLTMYSKPRPLLVTQPKTHHMRHPLTLTPCLVPLNTTSNHPCSRRPATNWGGCNFQRATAFFTWPPCHAMRASVLTSTSVPAVGTGMLCCAVSNSSPARCNRTAAVATPIGLPLALLDQITTGIFKGLDHSDNQWTMYICNQHPTKPVNPRWQRVFRPS